MDSCNDVQINVSLIMQYFFYMNESCTKHIRTSILFMFDNSNLYIHLTNVWETNSVKNFIGIPTS